MSASATGTKRRWLISAAGAVVIVGGLLFLFRAPRNGVTATLLTGEKPRIVFTAGHSDELAMRDLAPLFLPTRYNAPTAISNPPEPGADYFERDPGEHLFFNTETPGLNLPSPARQPAKPVEAIAEVPPPLAKGFGRKDRDIPALPPNGGHVDVFASNQRESILGVALGPDAEPPAIGGESVVWKPLEFMAAVDASGLVGPLVLTSGSGVEDVDNHFRNYLARTFRLGDRLPPGFYRIVVGP